MTKIAIIGATGLVGRTFISEIQRLKLPFDKILLFASPDSQGKTLRVGNICQKVFALTPDLFSKGKKQADVAFFCAGSAVSKEYAPKFWSTGSFVIDNSSYFRMASGVPLIAVEVNFNTICNARLVANPNCATLTAIPALNAIKPLGLKKARFVTFQSASGAGKRGLTALSAKDKNFFGADLTNNCIARIGEADGFGNTQEELKMQLETKKILDLPRLDVSATCVRVPTRYCHAVAVNVETEKDFDLQEIFVLLKGQKNLLLQQDLPLADSVIGKEYSVVGRVRKVGEKELSFFCVADNLRKGAASNAILIAKKIIEKGLLL